MKATRRHLLKTLFCSLLFISGISTAFAQQGQPPRSLKVLTIGNSFANDATRFLPEIVASADKEILLFRANLGGCTFERHAMHLNIALTEPSNPKGRPYSNSGGFRLPNNSNKTVSLPEALSAQPWDVVTIQQASPKSYLPESYEPYAGQVIAAVRKFAPTATIYIHQTWAWREDDARFQDGSLTQQKMFDGLRAAYRQLSQRYGDLPFIPSGAAVQAARQTPRFTFRPDPKFDYKNPPEGKVPDQSSSLQVGWRWVTKDKKTTFSLDSIHLNDAGRYLTGLVFFQTVYKTSCIGIPFRPDGISTGDAKLLQQIAHDAKP